MAIASRRMSSSRERSDSASDSSVTPSTSTTDTQAPKIARRRGRPMAMGEIIPRGPCRGAGRGGTGIARTPDAPEAREATDPAWRARSCSTSEGRSMPTVARGANGCSRDINRPGATSPGTRSWHVSGCPTGCSPRPPRSWAWGSARWGRGGGRAAPVDRFLAPAHATAERNHPMLIALARTRPLGVVSNFTGNLRPCLEELGLLECFELVLDSAVVGLRKPDERLFAAAFSALDVEPEACWMVGDNPFADIAPAAKLGCSTCWIAPAERPLPAGARPDRRIAALTELPAVLG